MMARRLQNNLLVWLLISLQVRFALASALKRKPRLTVAESHPAYFYRNIAGQTGTYSFGYDVPDSKSTGSQFRTEERFPNGTVVGSYGYMDPYGRPHSYKYIADARGYRVVKFPSPVTAKPARYEATTEPEITWTRRPAKAESNSNKKYNFYTTLT